MDWLVFGDDWGTHPSTEQHLVLNFPKEDRVIWIDSIGMRSPSFNMTDLRRVMNKASAMLNSSGDEGEEGSLYQGTVGGLIVIKPKVIPWHMNMMAQRFNGRSLARSIEKAMKTLGISKPVLLSSTPVVAQYLDDLCFSRLIYLRQDEYEFYPGCDPLLVQKTEPVMFDDADLIFVTARSLLPKNDAINKSQHLPHGVQYQHFAKNETRPSGKKVLGYFGTIDERMDFDLVKEVAESASDWQLEFIGDVLYKPDWIDSISNISFRPIVPFSELPSLLSDWTVAWIPYVRNHVTVGINPLKLREYLATGLAAHCTTLPEALHMTDLALVTDDAAEILEWMNDAFDNDTEDQRVERRKSVQHDDWSGRSKQFRDAVLDVVNSQAVY